MKDKIIPSLVLTLICAVCCGLLVFAHDLTYVDNTGKITDAMNKALTDIYGSSEGFEMMKTPEGDVIAYEGVTSVLKTSDGRAAFEITADGYSKGGLYMLVGLNSEGAVEGISIMTIGETPGLGTKVQDSAFLDQFKGLTNADDTDNIDNVTGASRSSRGMKNAVRTAVNTYNENKEAIFGE